MDQNISQEELDENQSKVDFTSDQISQAPDEVENSTGDGDKPLDDQDCKKEETVSQDLNFNQSQLQWMNRQVSNLERELLLHNNRYVNNNFVSNWTKVFLTAIAVMLPGIGQIIGIISGLIFVSSDIDSDKRSFGAALLTVSVIAFILSAVFWFILMLTFGPKLYY